MTTPERRFNRQLDAARRGDARAHRWLWDRHAGPITGFLMARGTPDVDEVVNDVFVAAFGRLDTFAGGESDFRTWLFAIARNKRVDQLRRWARRGAAEVASVPESAAVDDVEAAALDRLADDELSKVLESLTPDQRDVIVLRFIAGLSLEQTAYAVDKPTGAVKALQHRGLAQLRKRFSQTPYPATTSRTI